MKCDILDFDLNDNDASLKSVILRQKNRIEQSISKFLAQHPDNAPKRLPRVSFLRPTRSTSHTPTKVNAKLVPEVAAVSQMACLTSRTPAICRMVAL